MSDNQPGSTTPNGDEKAARFHKKLNEKTAYCYVNSHFPYTKGSIIAEAFKTVWCGGKASIDAFIEVYGPQGAGLGASRDEVAWWRDTFQRGRGGGSDL